MATRNEWDEQLQYYNKENQDDNVEKIKLGQKDDGEDNATAHFTACVALHNWACARSPVPCTFHHTHIGSSWVLPALHIHLHAIHGCLSLTRPTPLSTSQPSSCLSSFSPSSTSATSSSRSSTRRSWKTCATPPTTGVRAPTTSSTSPQFLVFTTSTVKVDVEKVRVKPTTIRFQPSSDFDFQSGPQFRVRGRIYVHNASGSQHDPSICFGSQLLNHGTLAPCVYFVDLSDDDDELLLLHTSPATPRNAQQSGSCQKLWIQVCTSSSRFFLLSGRPWVPSRQQITPTQPFCLRGVWLPIICLGGSEQYCFE